MRWVRQTASAAASPIVRTPSRRQPCPQTVPRPPRQTASTACRQRCPSSPRYRHEASISETLNLLSEKQTEWPMSRPPRSALSRSREGKGGNCITAAAATAATAGGPEDWLRLASTHSSFRSCEDSHRIRVGAARMRVVGMHTTAVDRRDKCWEQSPPLRKREGRISMPPSPLLSGGGFVRRGKANGTRSGGNEGGSPPAPSPATKGAGEGKWGGVLQSKGEGGGDAVTKGGSAGSGVDGGDGVKGGGRHGAGGTDATAGREGSAPAVGSSGGGGVGDLPHQVSEMYAEMERNLMSRMHAQDKNRFRAVGLSSLLLLIWVLSMFGTEIRRYFASQTAEVARETLKVEALQVQTQELATALVQALLNDHEVVRAGALFLREASANPETQAALVSLALYVLQHPETLAETQVLAKKLVQAILDDPDTVQQVTTMALKVMQSPRFRQGASELVVALGRSDEVYGAVTVLASRVIQDPQVQATLSKVLSESSREVLQNQLVFDRSKVFVAQVMGDDAVQRSGGDALWNTVQYALQTRLFKAVGLCLLAAGSAVLFSSRGGGGRGIGGGGGGSR